MKVESKNELLNLGIYVEGLEVYRNGRLLKERLQSRKHKYGKTISYAYYSIKGKLVSKSNIIYCWYIGDRDLSLDIDHIDGDSLNDDPCNLQLLTRKENLAKREIKGINQWYYIKGYNPETWEKMQKTRKKQFTSHD